MDTRVLLAAGTAAAVSMACFVASLWLGALGVFVGLATPLAPASVVIRHGERAGLLAVGFTTLALAGVGGIAWSLIYLIVHGSASLILPSLMQRQWRWDWALAVALIATLAAGAIGIALHGQQSETTVAQSLEEHIRGEITTALEAENAQFTAEQKAEIKEVGEQMVRIAHTAWPGLMALSSMALLSITLLGLSRIFKQQLPWQGPAFQDWKSPEWLVWPLIAVGFLTVLPQDGLSRLGANGLLILLPVYFLQGLAVVTCFMQRRGFSPFLRGLTYSMLVVINPMPLLVIGLGLFDLWFDFRKPRLKTD